MPTPDRRKGSPCASCTRWVGVFIADVEQREPEGDVLVVTHGGVIRVAPAYCSGIAVGAMAWGPVPNASVW